jgi:hypothetical protein
MDPNGDSFHSIKSSGTAVFSSRGPTADVLEPRLGLAVGAGFFQGLGARSLGSSYAVFGMGSSRDLLEAI